MCASTEADVFEHSLIEASRRMQDLRSIKASGSMIYIRSSPYSSAIDGGVLRVHRHTVSLIVFPPNVAAYARYLPGRIAPRLKYKPTLPASSPRAQCIGYKRIDILASRTRQHISVANEDVQFPRSSSRTVLHITTVCPLPEASSPRLRTPASPIQSTGRHPR